MGFSCEFNLSKCNTSCSQYAMCYALNNQKDYQNFESKLTAILSSLNSLTSSVLEMAEANLKLQSRISLLEKENESIQKVLREQNSIKNILSEIYPETQPKEER